MRKFKRLASIALAAVMTLAMCAPAFAVEGDGDGQGGGGQTPTETPTYTATYDVFQIFTGTYATDASGKEYLGNLKWGANGQYLVTEGEGDDKKEVNKADLNESVQPEVLSDLAEAAGDDGVHQGENDSTTGFTWQDKLATITKYVNLDSNPVASGLTLEEVNGLTKDPGYYLIRSNTVTGNYAHTTYVVEALDGTFNLQPKVSVPEVEKQIKDSQGNETSVNSAAVGDVLTFTLKGSLPTNLAEYTKYFYKFTDTMSAGLAYAGKDRVTVTLDGEDIKNAFEITEASSDGTTETTLTITATDLLTTINKESAAGKDIIVTYEATLTKDASMGATPTENDVKLTYSNDPYYTGNGTSPEDPDNPIPTGETVEGEKTKTKTYITGLTVTDFADNKPMVGAIFELTESTGTGIHAILEWKTEFKVPEDGEVGEYYMLKDGSYTKQEPTSDTEDQYDSTTTKYKKNVTIDVKSKDPEDTTPIKLTATTDASGSLTFAGLNVGSYTLHQVSAPDGYNSVEDISWNIEFDATTEKFSDTNDTKDMVREEGNWFYIELDQKLGTLLPETGGIGTTLLYIGGILLLAGAGATFILKGKKEEDVA